MTHEDISQELRLARANLREANKELARLREENAALSIQAQVAQENAQSAFAQLNMMRNTFTWQVTAPMRMLLGKFRL